MSKKKKVNINLVSALRQLAKERDIPMQDLVNILQTGLLSAYKKSYNVSDVDNIVVNFSQDTGQVRLFKELEVVKKVENKDTQISLKEAKELSSDAKIGMKIKKEITPDNFGRIAVQVTKQVMEQKLREKEISMIYEEFKDKRGKLITGVVRRREGSNVIIDLGKAEGILTEKEQVPRDRYRIGAKMKFLVLNITQTNKEPLILLSRSHPKFIHLLFQQEVPELEKGIVEIVNIARYPGYRTKLVVKSNNPALDPISPFIGHRRVRITEVLDEIRGERLDLIPLLDDKSKFIERALAPAKVLKVEVKESEKYALVVVADDQLSLAIGKEGQNAKLAAKITGYKIDIKSESQLSGKVAVESEQVFKEVS